MPISSESNPSFRPGDTVPRNALYTIVHSGHGEDQIRNFPQGLVFPT
jgi:hypothetical protein